MLKDISLKEDERRTSGIGELDRVLGGGIVPGSLVLVGGDPGIGKSTLLLQVCRNLAHMDASVLYISGEESLRQIKLRAKEFLGAELSPVLLFWWVETPVSGNPPFFYRYVEILHIWMPPCFISQVKSLCARLNFEPIVLENLMKI